MQSRGLGGGGSLCSETSIWAPLGWPSRDRFSALRNQTTTLSLSPLSHLSLLSLRPTPCFSRSVLLHPPITHFFSLSLSLSLPLLPTLFLSLHLPLYFSLSPSVPPTLPPLCPPTSHFLSLSVSPSLTLSLY